MKITIVKNRPSRGASALRDALRSRGHTVRFTKRYPLVIEWGKCTNKLQQLRAFNQHGVQTVEWTEDKQEALGYEVIYARTKLSGHSGEGIVVAAGADLEVPDAPLYTSGITGGRREYRVHVIGDQHYIQQKKRRSGAVDISNDIRNHHTGWVYTTGTMTTPPAGLVEEASKAVQALGLTYGAVDIITKAGNLWVLEVNTAPGLEGSTLDFYVNNFEQLLEGQQ